MTAEIKNTLLEIPGERISLRALRHGDIELIRQWRNQEHIRKWFKFSGIISEAQQQQWWEGYRQQDNDLMFIIWHKEQARPLGTIALYHIDLQAGSAEFGRLIIAAAGDRSQGFAKEASMTLIDWAWRHLPLRKIFLEVRHNNIAAVNLYKSLGFMETGRRDDFITMALTAGPQG